MQKTVPILYEDDYIFAVCKPNDMVVHHANYAKNVAHEPSLVQIVASVFGKKSYPIHRLDRKTSGVILFAKKTEYVSKLQTLFTSNCIQKTYYGLVRGFAPAIAIIDSPVKGRDAKVYKNAETHLKTLRQATLNISVKPYVTSRYSLVELQPKTGRLHQLRIHLNKISHPLIGDPKYGDNNHNHMFVNNFKTNKLFLHAKSLEFIQPFTEKEIAITADLPVHWISVFDAFGWELGL